MPDMSPLSSLPDEVLKLVMQYVPLSQRLTTCCLVNKRLYAAAVAATDDLDVLCDEAEEQEVLADHWQICMQPYRSDSLLKWLSVWGQHVTSLCLRGFPETLLGLPCQNLLHLRLEGGSVQLGAANGHPGVLQVCSKLTVLDVSCAIIDACQRAVIDLSRLVDLQHLQVQPILFPYEGIREEWNFYSLRGLSAATLPRLKHLTCLEVTSLSVRNVLQLSALTALQSLKLMTSGATLGPSFGLVFPASLKTLLVFSKIEAGILSLIPTGLQKLWIEGNVQGPAEGPSSLLSCLGRFQHLTELVVQPLHAPNLPPPGPAYSAFTASSNLASLYVSEGLLKKVWPCVFPPGRQLPHLTCFCHYAVVDARDMNPYSAWDAADVSALVQCCPNLIEIPHIGMQLGSHVSELHKLTALTSLRVLYGLSSWGAVQESLKSLATATQLQSLLLGAECRVGDLLPLTSLTALTSLRHTCYRSDYPGGMEPWRLDLCTEDDCKPDVWLQLLEQCAAAEPGPAVRTLALQLTEQQQRLIDQQQQNAAQQQRIASQDRHLSAQQQLAADQGALIAALQGQLQEFRAEVRQLWQHPAQ